jgi:hypothetical protein
MAAVITYQWDVVCSVCQPSCVIFAWTFKFTVIVSVLRCTIMCQDICTKNSKLSCVLYYIPRNWTKSTLRSVCNTNVILELYMSWMIINVASVPRKIKVHCLDMEDPSNMHQSKETQGRQHYRHLFYFFPELLITYKDNFFRLLLS